MSVFFSSTSKKRICAYLYENCESKTRRGAFQFRNLNSGFFWRGRKGEEKDSHYANESKDAPVTRIYPLSLPLFKLIQYRVQYIHIINREHTYIQNCNHTYTSFISWGTDTETNGAGACFLGWEVGVIWDYWHTQNFKHTKLYAYMYHAHPHALMLKLMQGPTFWGWRWEWFGTDTGRK
jgi:hypothetical protein